MLVFVYIEFINEIVINVNLYGLVNFFFRDIHVFLFISEFFLVLLLRTFTLVTMPYSRSVAVGEHSGSGYLFYLVFFAFEAQVLLHFCIWVPGLLNFCFEFVHGRRLNKKWMFFHFTLMRFVHVKFLNGSKVWDEAEKDQLMIKAQIGSQLRKAFKFGS